MLNPCKAHKDGLNSNTKNVIKVYLADKIILRNFQAKALAPLYAKNYIIWAGIVNSFFRILVIRRLSVSHSICICLENIKEFMAYASLDLFM